MIEWRCGSNNQIEISIGWFGWVQVDKTYVYSVLKLYLELLPVSFLPIGRCLGETSPLLIDSFSVRTKPTEPPRFTLERIHWFNVSLLLVGLIGKIVWRYCKKHGKSDEGEYPKSFFLETYEGAGFHVSVPV